MVLSQNLFIEDEIFECQQISHALRNSWEKEYLIQNLQTDLPVGRYFSGIPCFAFRPPSQHSVLGV